LANIPDVEAELKKKIGFTKERMQAKIDGKHQSSLIKY